MRLGTFRNRILASAVGTAVLALVLVLFTVSTTLDQVRARDVVTVPDAVVAACAAVPGGWAEVRFGSSRVRAFDAAGRSSDPGAPGLEVPPLAVGEVQVRIDGPRRTVIARTPVDGPCAYLELVEGPRDEQMGWVPWALGVGTALAVLVVGIATYMFTVRPLLRRIDQIRGAAVGVGTEAYRSGDDPIHDRLNDIARVLDTSNARILADRDELVRRHHALERHLAEIAHDLRTPLGSLSLALEEVEAEVGGLASVRRAHQDLGYVSTLVENLHHAARLRHGLDPLEAECDLREIVLGVEVRFRALGRASGVEVAASVPDEPVVVRCTPALAERALANLVHNAITHGGQHAAVVLTRTGDGFEVVVLDDGDGVPEPASLGLRTFTDDPARARGQGLGLAITNEVARRVGWTITYAPGDPTGLAVHLRGEHTL
ncbi:MAG: HAMP domain-containing sensor histidine kinase [Myxococcota bacterium]